MLGALGKHKSGGGLVAVGEFLGLDAIRARLRGGKVRMAPTLFLGHAVPVEGMISPFCIGVRPPILAGRAMGSGSYLYYRIVVLGHRVTF